MRQSSPYEPIFKDELGLQFHYSSASNNLNVLHLILTTESIGYILSLDMECPNELSLVYKIFLIIYFRLRRASPPTRLSAIKRGETRFFGLNNLTRLVSSYFKWP